MAEENNEKGQLEKAEAPQGPNFDGIEAQIESLHDNLDNIKQAGKELQEAISEELPEDADQEDVMEANRLMMKADLLTRRVENGDRNVVRGE